MAHWLIKSEPEVYGWDQLVKDKQTRWDGIRNYAARLHLRTMKKGDEIFFYHSNKYILTLYVGWFDLVIPLSFILEEVWLYTVNERKRVSNT